MDHKRTGSALTGPPLKNISTLSMNSASSPHESAAAKARSTSVATVSTVASNSPSTPGPSGTSGAFSSSTPMSGNTAASGLNSSSNPNGSTPATTDASTDAAADIKTLQARSVKLLDDPKFREAAISDHGPNALLTRAKQSITSTKEFATYVKKLATLESEHLTAMKKVARNTRDSIKRPDSRQGTFNRQFDEIVRTNERACDVVNAFVAALLTMHDELNEIAKQTERVRKSIKETSVRQEKFVSDAESAAEKARSKYESLCEEYDRMKTGDPQKKFGFKQSRTPQHEEDLQRKVQAADTDYQQKVTQAQKARKDLIEKQRPATAKQLQDLILECDSGLTFQLQKYSNLNETLALNRGFIIMPLKDDIPTANPNLSMKEKVSKIDNELDLYSFVVGTTKGKAADKKMISYKPHPSMGSTTTKTPSTFISSPSNFTTTSSSFSATNTSTPAGNFSAASSAPLSSPNPINRSTSPVNQSAPSPSLPLSTAADVSPVSTSTNNLERTSTSDPLASGSLMYPPGTSTPSQSVRVFGTPLDVLLDFEESTVPRVVYQCVQAVDNFGLEIEGIYRASGNSAQVQEIKRLFDTNSENVDLLHPTSNVNDIHSVASALKLYFRELPDPLLTRELHADFIKAAQEENDIKRRDAVHSAVNNLPDPNYTTLRFLAFHLYRVQEREAMNRMSIGNLGIVWGPTLMNTDYTNVSEMAIQGKVVETILYNAYVIFDAE